MAQLPATNQPGALNVTQPSHLLAKLEHELQALKADPGNSYAAINALRDAYHLREWIWHDRLKNDAALRSAIMGGQPLRSERKASGSRRQTPRRQSSRTMAEDAWNGWVNQQFADFPIVRELCNGSKHFTPRDEIHSTHTGGFDSLVPFFDNPFSGWDDIGFQVRVDTGRLISIVDLVTRVHDFWRGLAKQFPQLA